MFSSFSYIKETNCIPEVGEEHAGDGTYRVYSRIERLGEKMAFIAFKDQGSWRHEFIESLKCNVKPYYAPHVLLPITHFRNFFEALKKFSNEKKYPDFKVDAECLMNLLIALYDAKHIDKSEAGKLFSEIPSYFRGNYAPIDKKYGNEPLTLDILEKLSIEYPYGAADPNKVDRYKQMFFKKPTELTSSYATKPILANYSEPELIDAEKIIKLKMTTPPGMMLQTLESNIIALNGVNIEGTVLPKLVSIPEHGLSKKFVVNLDNNTSTYYESKGADITLPERADPTTLAFAQEMNALAMRLRESSQRENNSHTTVYVLNPDATIYTGYNASPNITVVPRKEKNSNNNTGNNNAQNPNISNNASRGAFIDAGFSKADSSNANTRVINITGDNQTFIGHIGQRITISPEGAISQDCNQHSVSNPVNFSRPPAAKTDDPATRLFKKHD